MYTSLEHRFVNGSRNRRLKMKFVRLMPMVHDTEIDAVNSIFLAAVAAAATQAVMIFFRRFGEPK